MTIVTRQQLKEQRNLTDAFIRKHDKDMCGRGKPRRYDMALVDEFLYSYFRENVLFKDVKYRSALKDLNNFMEAERYSRTGPSEMVGKGGRAS